MNFLIRTFSAVFFSVGVFLACSISAANSTPIDDSCDFVAALNENGKDPGISFLEELAAENPLWSRATTAKLRTTLGPVTSKFHYVGGEVYIIADMGNTTQEHMIAMRSRNGGIAYFRILYEWNGSKLSFINIKIKSSYYEMVQLGGIVSYTKVDC